MPASLPAAQKPNFIFILSDDIAQGDLGCYGQKLIQTPRLDAMAEQGTRYLQAYCGTTVCAPSRASFFTGLHSGHCPIRGNYELPPEGQYPIPDQTVTIAEVAKAAGYATAIFGKTMLMAAESFSIREPTTGLANTKPTASPAPTSPCSISGVPIIPLTAATSGCPWSSRTIISKFNGGTLGIFRFSNRLNLPYEADPGFFSASKPPRTETSMHRFTLLSFILFVSCRNVRVEGITLRNSGVWNQHYRHCGDGIVNRIQVDNHVITGNAKYSDVIVRRNVTVMAD